MKSELRGLVQKLHTDELVLNYGGRAVPARPADLVRVLSEWSQRDILDLTIRNIIVDAILSSENKQVGSGIICAASILHGDCDTLLKLPIKKIRPVREDMSNILKYFLSPGIVYELCESLLEMGGMSSSLRFHLNRHDNFLIKQIDTHELFGVVHPLFGGHPSFIDSPVILIIDGIVETLGEIDYLLQRAAEAQCPVIICAMGFGADVVNTLSHNWKSGKLKVIPFWIQEWNHDQTALQVCDKLGLTCVSSERGDAANTLDLDECSRIDIAFLSDQSLAIQNDGGGGGHLEVHFPQRLKSMSGLLEDRCRIALRGCVGVALNGKASSSLTRKITDPLGIPVPMISYASQYIGIRSAASCENIINNLGCIIAP